MILLNLEAPTDILVPSIASHTVIIFACASAVQKWIRRVHWAWYANVFLRLRTIEIKQKYNNNIYLPPFAPGTPRFPPVV